MSFCRKCGTELGQVDFFCGKCGMPRNGNRSNDNTRNQESHQRSKAPRVNAMETKEGRARFDEIVNKKNASASAQRKRRWIICIFLLSICVASALFASVFQVRVWFLVSGVLFFASLLKGSHALNTAPDYWTQADYYSIPGSRNQQGEHNCIYCGNRGIYTHGAYASSIEYSDCSRCKTTLWLA
jgi:hypothetical protein